MPAFLFRIALIHLWGIRMRKITFTAILLFIILAASPGAHRVLAQKTTSNVALPQAANICDYAGKDQAKCNSCMGKGTATWTAIGCIDTNPSGFLPAVLAVATSIGGGIAFILMLLGGFQIMTSAGNPEQLNAGRELLGSAIAGLLLIIFSLFILQFIGYRIFNIPGFG